MDNEKFKVNPSDKKIEDIGERSLKDEARLLIKNHPEIWHNAREYFRNKNFKQIVEEIVPRGDLGTEEVIYPRNQGDLTERDLRALAIHASMIVDDTLMQYDPKVACEDALRKTIWYKDNGKYAGKVNANTFNLMLGYMDKIKKASEQPKNKEAKEEKMDKEALKKDLQVLQKKAAAIETLLSEDSDNSKEAAAETFKCPTCGNKVLKKTGYCVVCKKKVKPKEAGSEKKATEEKEEYRSATEEIVSQIDEIAETLEKQNDPKLMKYAYQLDLVSEVLEGKKEAKALESEADEEYMKKYFVAGARETDADENRYMTEFNNDNTQEVAKLRGKAAADLPYQKKS